MRVTHLLLENFRNIERLELSLPQGRTVLVGENAQGKTNILEAVYCLAIAKSVRAGHERELIRWDVLSEPLPHTRVTGSLERQRGNVTIEIVMQLNPPGSDGEDGQRQLLKRVKVNNIPKRLSDVVGEVQAVLFEPQDIELVYGTPSVRRHHLDLTLSQVDRQMLRELQRFNRTLSQRNPLLKSIRDGEADVDELAYWDGELTESGAYIIEARGKALGELDTLSAKVHNELTGARERLRLLYRPSVERAGEQAITEMYRTMLTRLQAREIAAGTTLAGPHRDDFAFEVNDVSLAAYGSRGQQRLATLSLKLAEARFMTARIGEQPLLLLDDVLSELDAPRRGYLMRAIGEYGQSLLTTADAQALDSAYLAQSNVLRVESGRVSLITAA